MPNPDMNEYNPDYNPTRQEQILPGGIGGISIPSSNTLKADEESQYRFYKNLITPAPELYPILLLNFYSAEVTIQRVKVGTTRLPSGKEIPTYKRLPTLKRIPDNKRQCPICNTIKDDEDYETCQGESGPKHKPVQTKYLNWFPLMTSAGFTFTASTIMANLTPNITTGNLPIEKNFQKRIIRLAHYIDEALYEHQDEYVNPEIYLSLALRTTIEATIINNVLAFASGSQGGKTIDRITKQTSVVENISNQPKAQQSMGGKLTNWWHW